MVLHHVADGTDLVVELAAPFDTERLGHRNLHALDVVAVPDRLKERVGEAEVEKILDGLLTQIMVDAVDRMLGEELVDGVVEFLRRFEVTPERLLDHDAPAPLPRAGGPGQGPGARRRQGSGGGRGTDR